MNAWDRPQTTTAQSQSTAVDQGLRSYMLKVYNYMASALLLTGIIAYGAFTASIAPGADGQLALTSFGEAIFVSPLKWVIMLAPLGMVIALGAGVQRMKTSTMQACFWVFSGLMGLSMAYIFMIYTGGSIARTFFITAAMFGGMSIFGYSTKKDLTGMGHFMRMGVWGLFLAFIVNIFLQSSALDLALSAIGVVIFTGLIAYDTQKLKGIYYSVAGYGDALARASIMGALSLYLDFINLFIMLLRFTGNRR